MRHMSVAPKTVAYYIEKSERTIRRMCERGELEAERVGGDWAISSSGLKRRFWRLGRDFWRRVCFDMYNDKNDAEDAFLEYVEIAAVELSKAQKK